MKQLLILILTVTLLSSVAVAQNCPDGTCPYVRPITTQVCPDGNCPYVQEALPDNALNVDRREVAPDVAPMPIKEKPKTRDVYVAPEVTAEAESQLQGGIRDLFGPRPVKPSEPDTPEDTVEPSPESPAQPELSQALFDRFKTDQSALQDEMKALAKSRSTILDRLANIGRVSEENAKERSKSAAKQFKLLQDLRRQNSELSDQIFEQQEVQKGLLQRLREGREERGTLKERMQEFKPLQNLLKRGTTLVWYAAIFLGSLLLVGAVFILILIFAYRRLSKKISDLI